MTTLTWIAICAGTALISAALAYWIGHRNGRADAREELESQGFTED